MSYLRQVRMSRAHDTWFRRPRVDDGHNYCSPVGFRALRPIRRRVPAPLRPQAIRDVARPLNICIARTRAAASLRTQRFGRCVTGRTQLLRKGRIASLTKRPKDNDGWGFRLSCPLGLRPGRRRAAEAAVCNESGPIATGLTRRRGHRCRPTKRLLADREPPTVAADPKVSAFHTNPAGHLARQESRELDRDPIWDPRQRARGAVFLLQDRCSGRRRGPEFVANSWLSVRSR